MPFTAQELENIANAAIDFHWRKKKVVSQTIQDKPLLTKMRSAQKTFPGGKEYITVGVKGTYTTTIQGFSHDDTVTYANPANIKRAQYPWKLIHAGISISMHELAKDGISVVDSTTGEKTTEHSEREMTALANILEDKLEDMDEGIDRGVNEMYWRDGTQDSDLIPGVTSFVVDSPSASAVVGGIDQVAANWWRNRANLNISGSVADLAVVNTLQTEMRQLRRYGGRPNLGLAGASMMERLEQEFRSKGYFTLDGFAKGPRFDLSVTDLKFKNIEIDYDPTLDDLGYTKRLYLLDTKHIYPKVMEGEDWKDHAPARPESKYVFYRAKTYIGGLVCDQRNCHGVYAIP